jgi:serine/threonine protein kinase
MHNEGGVNECIPGDCEIIHRDLKLENILLSQESSGDPYPEIRLIDFGTARNLTKDYKHHELIGTPNYMAPEVLHSNKNAKPPRYYGSKCDMWSMGVICYALLCGRLPLDIDHNL